MILVRLGGVWVNPEAVSAVTPSNAGSRLTLANGSEVYVDGLTSDEVAELLGARDYRRVIDG